MWALSRLGVNILEHSVFEPLIGQAFLQFVSSWLRVTRVTWYPIGSNRHTATKFYKILKAKLFLRQDPNDCWRPSIQFYLYCSIQSFNIKPMLGTYRYLLALLVFCSHIQVDKINVAPATQNLSLSILM